MVEDNKINQMITKKILNKMKLNCDIVDNGEDAVDKVKTEDYDVVLMDIHMPGISGIEATKIIRTFDRDITIFALTAVTIEDKMDEFEDGSSTHRVAEVIIAKHRNGPVGEVKLKFIDTFARFEDLDQSVGGQDFSTDDVNAGFKKVSSKMNDDAQDEDPF